MRVYCSKRCRLVRGGRRKAKDAYCDGQSLIDLNGLANDSNAIREWQKIDCQRLVSQVYCLTFTKCEWVKWVERAESHWSSLEWCCAVVWQNSTYQSDKLMCPQINSLTPTHTVPNCEWSYFGIQWYNHSHQQAMIFELFRVLVWLSSAVVRRPANRRQEIRQIRWLNQSQGSAQLSL